MTLKDKAVKAYNEACKACDEVEEADTENVQGDR